MNKYTCNALFAMCSMFAATSTLAASIIDIPNPKLTEVKSIDDGKYFIVSDMKGLQFPLSAEADGTQLVFAVDGKKYSVSRADVRLADEHLVKPSCLHVSATLPTDARSASVKGSGDGC